jgi:DNA-binding transcriptional LysR family regulator
LKRPGHKPNAPDAVRDLDHQAQLAVVPERAVGHLRRTADVRFLEAPMDLPPITGMLWWNPRRTMDPAHAWLRARIADIAAELEQAEPGRHQP